MDAGGVPDDDDSLSRMSKGHVERSEERRQTDELNNEADTRTRKQQAMTARSVESGVALITGANVATTQTMLPLLRRSPAGRVVNMSSGVWSLTQTSNGRIG